MSDKILVAVSGGKDSMYLLNRLISDGHDVVAAHYNHAIRGKEADRDESFVKEYCKANNIAFISEKCPYKINSEDEARKYRYDFLERARDFYNCDYIATAHTLDDNVETVVMNMIRGTGLRGLCGIPFNRDKIVRPIIDVSSSVILEYIEMNNIPYVEDSSNKTDEYTRNIIRHKIIPVFKEINPSFLDAFQHMICSIDKDEKFLEFESSGFELNDISFLPYPIAARVIKKHFNNSFSWKNIDDIIKFSKGNGYGELSLPGLTMIREQGSIKIDVEKKSYSVSIEQCIVTDINNSLNTCYLKCDSIVGQIDISNKRDGDKIRIEGRNCTKSLKKLFLEANLSNEEKNNIPVLRDGLGVVYVYNLAQREGTKASLGDNAYKVTVTEITNNGK